MHSIEVGRSPAYPWLVRISMAIQWAPHLAACAAVLPKEDRRPAQSRPKWAMASWTPAA
jgi:hypothetical protein